MKFKVLTNDGMSYKPFTLSETEAKNKEEVYELLGSENDFTLFSAWVLNEDEFKQLQKIIKDGN